MIEGIYGFDSPHFEVRSLNSHIVGTVYRVDINIQLGELLDVWSKGVRHDTGLSLSHTVPGNSPLTSLSPTLAEQNLSVSSPPPLRATPITDVEMPSQSRIDAGHELITLSVPASPSIDSAVVPKTPASNLSPVILLSPSTGVTSSVKVSPAQLIQ